MDYIKVAEHCDKCKCPVRPYVPPGVIPMTLKTIQQS